MKAYKFVGEVKFGRGRLPFTKVVEGKSREHAIHKLYSLFGSKNGLKRTAVKIIEVKEYEEHG